MTTRINKINKTTPVSADELLIYDSEDTINDKNITLGQMATFTENQNSTVTGTKIFSSGVDFQKGFIAYGQYSPLPTGIGSYVAGYTHPTYGARILGYNGSAYQDLYIGSMPTAGTPSIKSLTNGDVNFGYNTNTNGNSIIIGNCTANKYYGDGSELVNIRTIIQKATCSTASATAEKDITISGATLTDGYSFIINFTNANTNTVPTLNINSIGAKHFYNETGNQIDGTHYFAYFPACKVECIYNSTLDGFIFKNRIVENYINGTSWYKVYSNGWIEQGGKVLTSAIAETPITLLKAYKDTNYSAFAQFVGLSSNSTILTCKIADLTTTNFGLYKSNAADSDYFYWHTCGY